MDCLSRVPGEAILLTDKRVRRRRHRCDRLLARLRDPSHRDARCSAAAGTTSSSSGMQSVDGDTAQVPPQIAEELGIDHIAYAKGLRDGAATS